MTDPFDTRQSLKEQNSAHRNRVGLVAALFHLLDTGLFALYAQLGIISFVVPIAFVAIGGLLGVCWHVASTPTDKDERRVESLDAIVQGGLCCTYLGVAFLFPYVGFPALMSVGNLTASTAMRLRAGLMLSLLVPIALAAASILLLKGPALSAPLASAAEICVTSAWVVAVLFRGAFINLTGLELKARIGKANRLLTEALAKIEVLASHDELTGLLNRRSLQYILQGRALEQPKDQDILAVALLDIDHFKRVNDNFGHGIGDAVLQRFAQVIQTVTRSSDCIGRWGGEEFLLISAGQLGSERLHKTGERLRAAVESHDWSILAPGLSITTSIGITSWSQRKEAADAAIARADALLYQAKSEGRNRVCLG